MTTAPTSEMRGLVDRLLDHGGLSRVETSRLEELLENRNAMRYYTEVMSLDALMAEALDGIEVEEKTLRFPNWMLAMGALAAAACLVFSLFVFLSGEKPVALQPMVSTPIEVEVTGLHGVEWEKDLPSVLPNGKLAAERVVTRSGFLELTYASGVRVTLQGPTDFTVKGTASGALTHGKLVANVPPGAEGFTVDYGTGRVVDLGTEFGLGIDGGKVELAVFDGSVKIDLPDGTSRTVSQGQALVHDGGVEDIAREIPQDANRFSRSIPFSEFPWELRTNELSEIEMDVTHLITKPSKYLAVFKWQEGPDGVTIRDVELRLDGKRVAVDSHEGATGEPVLVNKNWFLLDLPAEKFAPGRWTLHAKWRVIPRFGGQIPPKEQVMSKGVLLVEEGFAPNATAEDFIGRWSYQIGQRQHVCEFHEDGDVTYTVDGRPESGFLADARWEIDGGVLKVWFPHRLFTECHILRDAKTLVFITELKANAVKIEEK